jgi:hypothetical protein
VKKQGKVQEKKNEKEREKVNWPVNSAVHCKRIKVNLEATLQRFYVF